MGVPDPQGGEEYRPGPVQPPAMPGYGYPAPAPGYGYPTPGYGYPQQQPGPPAPFSGAPLVALGDITVTGDLIITPSGNLPLRGAMWNATDLSHTEERIPAHAIVLAVLFFVFCLLGLLFLLMKERKTTGYVQVAVTSGGRHHSTMIPALSPQTFPQVMVQVNYARSLSAR